MKRTMIALVALFCAIAGACGGSDGDPREAAYNLADDSIACSDDADCCVVGDFCKAASLLVRPGDLQRASDLLAHAPWDTCAGCGGNRPIQARCASGTCVLREVVNSADGSSMLYRDQLGDFTGDHCGTLSVPTGFEEKPVSTIHGVLHCP